MRESNDTTTVKGKRGEDQAASFLSSHGLTIVSRNYRCRGGEIDIICRHGNVLIFVEVRLRRDPHFGGAAASITPAKQRRIVLAARHFLLETGQNNADCRIDCVLIDANELNWIKNAIAAD